MILLTSLTKIRKGGGELSFNSYKFFFPRAKILPRVCCTCINTIVTSCYKVRYANPWHFKYIRFNNFISWYGECHASYHSHRWCLTGCQSTARVNYRCFISQNWGWQTTWLIIGCHEGMARQGTARSRWPTWHDAGFAHFLTLSS